MNGSGKETTVEEGSKSERIQVIVPPGAYAELMALAETEGRSLSDYCRRVLVSTLEIEGARRTCEHKECVRIAVAHDQYTMTCIDCGATVTMTTDEIRRSGTIVHARGPKEAR